MAGSQNIAGGWLGTYAYKGRASRQPPVRFEATFRAGEGRGSFTGTILDDGPNGEANATGIQDGRLIRFTKIYICPPGYIVTGPITYDGTLSEDGRILTGTWRLSLPGQGNLSGVWDARRMWEEAAETEQMVYEAELTIAARAGSHGPRF